MMDDYEYRNLGFGGTTLAAPKYDKHPVPMPSRDELLRRNSFGSPDDNKYLNLVKPTAAVPKTPDEASRRLAVQKKWGVE